MKMLLLLFCAAFLCACGPDEPEKCVPDCDGKECGDDGCGGTCGEGCGAGKLCMVDQCFPCEPSCLGRQCGPDGCGGTCGLCSGTQVCDGVSPLCVDRPTDCVPVCEEHGFLCGPDGCGAECGTCDEMTLCNQNTRTCLEPCKPSCDGKKCGDDGCGGSCGDCAQGEFCDNGICILSSVLPDDEFTILFGQQGRIPGENEDEHDLFLINPDRTNPLAPGTPGPLALTTFSLAGTSDCQLILAEDEQGNPTEYGPCSCNFGCVVDRSLKWIAVSVKKPGASGFTFQLGRFDAQMKVAMVKGIFMKDVTDFKFAGNFLYFSRQHECDGAHCKYMISRVQLEPVGQIEELLVFPPEGDPDWPKHSDYKGHFKTSRDGSMLVILGTTIRSVRIYIWKQGTLHEIDYICNHLVNGDCIGAGSEYTDTDPIAISPDNSKVAAFTMAETDLRLRVYDTQTLQQKYLNLFSVPTGTYLAESCKYMEPDWRFQRVVGDPVFTADGKSLLFVAYTACGQISSTSKPHSDILMLDLASVGDGTQFQQGDFLNITKNPKSDGAENVVIEAFDISPSGKTIVLTGTPKFTFSGDPLKPFLDPVSEKRALKDMEVWVIGVSGAGLTQLTDDTKVAAKTPMGLDSSVIPNYNSP